MISLLEAKNEQKTQIQKKKSDNTTKENTFNLKLINQQQKNYCKYYKQCNKKGIEMRNNYKKRGMK